MRNMKFKIDYKYMADENYPISKIFSVETEVQSKEEAIEKFKTYRPLCVMININEIE